MGSFRENPRKERADYGDTVIRVSTRRAILYPTTVTNNWWEAVNGVVAAYQPKGASSLANSYINLANPGTYDAAPGTAPTWNTSTGWSFNGSTQYLLTGVVPNDQYTVLVAIGAVTTAADANGHPFIGTGNNGASSSFQIGNTTTNKKYYSFGNYGIIGTSNSEFVSGDVIGLNQNYGYLNGTEDETISEASMSTSYEFYIGARNNDGSPDRYADVDIYAIWIGSSLLSTVDVATLTTAMQAL